MEPYLFYDSQVKKTGRLRKVVDETTQVRCALRKGVIREEVWHVSRGVVAKYNLAFINHALCAEDNGRAVGYDKNHGDHPRHFAGAEEKFGFISYEKLLERFLNEGRGTPPAEGVDMTLRINTDGFEGYAKRALERARKLDRREAIKPEITITFEDPLAMVEVLTAERVSGSFRKCGQNPRRSRRLRPR